MFADIRNLTQLSVTDAVSISPEDAFGTGNMASYSDAFVNSTCESKM